mgnify:CR=1 FL=1
MKKQLLKERFQELAGIKEIDATTALSGLKGTQQAHYDAGGYHPYMADKEDTFRAATEDKIEQAVGGVVGKTLSKGGLTITDLKIVSSGMRIDVEIGKTGGFLGMFKRDKGPYLTKPAISKDDFGKYADQVDDDDIRLKPREQRNGQFAYNVDSDDFSFYPDQFWNRGLGGYMDDPGESILNATIEDVAFLQKIVAAYNPESEFANMPVKQAGLANFKMITSDPNTTYESIKLQGKVLKLVVEALSKRKK